MKYIFGESDFDFVIKMESLKLLTEKMRKRQERLLCQSTKCPCLTSRQNKFFIQGQPFISYFFNSVHFLLSPQSALLFVYPCHDELIICQEALSFFFFKCKMVRTSFGKVKLHKEPLWSPIRVLVHEILPRQFFFWTALFLSI